MASVYKITPDAAFDFQATGDCRRSSSPDAPNKIFGHFSCFPGQGQGSIKKFRHFRSQSGFSRDAVYLAKTSLQVIG